MYHTPRMCRTCLQMSRGDFKFVSLDSVDPLWESNSPNLKEQLISLIPEMNIDSSGAFICTSCFIALRTAYEFKRMCQQTEEKFQSHNYKYRRPFGVGPGSAQFHVALNENFNDYQDSNNYRCQNLNYLQADTSIDITEHHLYDANKVLPRKQLTMLNNVTQKLPEIDVEVIMPPEKPPEKTPEKSPEELVPPKKLDSFALRRKYNIGSEISILKSENKNNSNIQALLKTACEVIPDLKEKGISPDLLTCYIQLQRLTQEFVKINTCEKYSLDEIMEVTKNYYFDQLDESLTCQFCTKSFTTRFSLQIHEDDHAVDKFFNCSSCEMQFLRQNNLEQHMKTHDIKPSNLKVEEKKIFVVTMDGVINEKIIEIITTVNIKESVKEEMKVENKQEESMEEGSKAVDLQGKIEQVKTELEAKLELANEDADLEFNAGANQPDIKGILNDQGIVLKSDEMVISTPNKKLKNTRLILKKSSKRHLLESIKYCKCLICNKMCRNKLQLNQHRTFSHVPKVSPRYWPNILSQTRLKRKSNSQTPIVVETDDENLLNPYKCNICDKSFSEENFLTLHMYVHTVTVLTQITPSSIGDDGPEVYTCYLCNKGFTKERYLKLHNLHVHLSKTTTCKICNRAFKSEFWFSRHRCQLPVEGPEVQEDENKTYPCTFCNRSFARLRFMKSHRKRMHNDIMTRCTKTKPKHFTNRNGRRDIEISNLDLDDPMKLYTIAGSSAFEDDEEEDEEDDIIEILSDTDESSDEGTNVPAEPIEEEEVNAFIQINRSENQNCVEIERPANDFDISNPKPNNESDDNISAFRNLSEISTRRKSVGRSTPKIQCDFCGNFIEENVYDNHIYEHNKIRLQKSARKPDTNYDSTLDDALDKNKIILKCHICFRGFQRKYHLLNHINRHLNGEITLITANQSEEVDENEDGQSETVLHSQATIEAAPAEITIVPTKRQLEPLQTDFMQTDNNINDLALSENDATQSEDEEAYSENETIQQETEFDEATVLNNLAAANNSNVYECCGRRFKLKAHFFRHYKIKHPFIATGLSRRERRRAKAQLKEIQDVMEEQEKAKKPEELEELEEEPITINNKARYFTRTSTSNQSNNMQVYEDDEKDEKGEDDDVEVSEEDIDDERIENVSALTKRRFSVDEVNEEVPTKRRRVLNTADTLDTMETTRRTRTKTDSDAVSTKSRSRAATPVSFDDVEMLATSPKLALKYECTICDKKFKQKCQLRDHINVHTGDKPYKCDFCHPARGFTQTSSLYVHYRRVHAEIMKNCLWEVYSKNGACLICTDVFEKHAHMFQHVKDNYIEKTFECHMCSDKLNMICHYKMHDIDPEAMRKVIQDHLDEEEKAKLKSEDGSCTPSSSLTEETMDSEADSLGTDPEALKCEPCNKLFRRKPQLRFHKKSLAHFQQAQLLKKQVPIKVDEDTVVSGVETDTIEEIQNNVKAIMEKISNIKRHRCAACGMSFVKKMHLRKHKRKMHRVVRPKLPVDASALKMDDKIASDTQFSAADTSTAAASVIDQNNLEEISNSQSTPEMENRSDVNFELETSTEPNLEDAKDTQQSPQVQPNFFVIDKQIPKEICVGNQGSPATESLNEINFAFEETSTEPNLEDAKDSQKLPQSQSNFSVIGKGNPERICVGNQGSPETESISDINFELEETSTAPNLEKADDNQVQIECSFSAISHDNANDVFVKRQASLEIENKTNVNTEALVPCAQLNATSGLQTDQEKSSDDMITLTQQVEQFLGDIVKSTDQEHELEAENEIDSNLESPDPNKLFPDVEELKGEAAEVADSLDTACNVRDSLEFISSNIGDSLGSVSNIGDFLESPSNIEDSAQSTFNIRDSIGSTSNVGEPLELADNIGDSIDLIELPCGMPDSSEMTSGDLCSSAENEILDFVHNSASIVNERLSASVAIGLGDAKSLSFVSANHSFEHPGTDFEYSNNSHSSVIDTTDILKPHFGCPKSSFHFPSDSVPRECQKSIALAECTFEYQENYLDIGKESLDVVSNDVNLESVKSLTSTDEQCLDVDK